MVKPLKEPEFDSALDKEDRLQYNNHSSSPWLRSWAYVSGYNSVIDPRQSSGSWHHPDNLEAMKMGIADAFGDIELSVSNLTY